MPISPPEIVVAIEFQPQRRDAGGFRREFVVADGGEAIAKLRTLDAARNRERDDRERQHQRNRYWM